MGVVCGCTGLFSLESGDFFGGQAKFPSKSISQPHKVEKVPLGAFQVNNYASRILCVGYSRHIVVLVGFIVGHNLHKLILNPAE